MASFATQYERCKEEFKTKLTVSAAIQFHSQRYITIPALRVKSHIPGLERNSEAMQYNIVSFAVAVKNLEDINRFSKA